MTINTAIAATGAIQAKSPPLDLPGEPPAALDEDPGAAPEAVSTRSELDLIAKAALLPAAMKVTPDLAAAGTSVWW